MKISNKNIFSFLMSIVLVFSAVSCQDMFDTGSDRLVFENENTIKNENDLFYSISGLLADVQTLGDKYVVWGELRADLMNVSDGANSDLKEIAGLQVSTGNSWAMAKDFYNVINNCNYILQKVDTSKTDHNAKVMLPGYAEVKTIRAWTYFQLAQIYGKLKYIDKPVLNLESALETYPELTLDQLVDKLIADLEPLQSVQLPSSTQAPDAFVPLQLLLGDLYLYRNDYEKAATLYYAYINTYSVVMSGNYTSKWNATTFDDATITHRDSYRDEAIASIRYSSDPRLLHSALVGLTYSDNASLLPSDNYMQAMALAPAFYSDKLGNAITASNEGDLRARVNISKKGIQYGDATSIENFADASKHPLIYKFFYRANQSSTGSDPGNGLIKNGLVYNTQLPLYRIPQLYLRFAEAVNRTGKPSFAFAVLKYGLTKANIANTAMVNKAELQKNEAYLNFQNSAFDANVPSASRGRGLGIPKDTKSFIIPDYTRYVNGQDKDGKPIMVSSADPTDMAAAQKDSVEFVELRILDELAAETAFEGNRFFDLLRISRRRPNHPEFMATKVAARFSDPSAVKSRLMNINSWFAK